MITVEDLRPVPDSQGGESHFIGESYVHGIMDEEMMMKLSEKNYLIITFSRIM